MMKVLLIGPPFISETARRRIFVQPPIGLAYVHGALRKHGIESKIIDSMALDLNEKQIKHIIKKEKPDVVGTSALVTSSKSALKILEIAKDIDSEIVTIAGGVFFTFYYKPTLKEHPYVDFIIRGEGELTAIELIKTLNNAEHPDKLKEIVGIAFKNENRIIKTGERDLIQNLDEFPFPWEDLPVDKYVDSGLRRAIAISSRGCKFNCSFCTQGKFWRNKWRSRSAENVCDEMEALRYKYNFKYMRFGDECFNVDIRRVGKICDILIERGIDIQWSFESRIDDILKMKDLMPKLKKAGVVSIFTGIESPYFLKEFRKNITLHQIKKAIRLLKENDIVSVASFIIGHRKDTRETILGLSDYVADINPDFFMFCFLTPLPGTAFYEKALKEGWLEVTDFEYYDYSTPVMPTETLSREELMSLAKELWIKTSLREEKLREYLTTENMFKKGLFYTMLHCLVNIAPESMKKFSHHPMLKDVLKSMMSKNMHRKIPEAVA